MRHMRRINAAAGLLLAAATVFAAGSAGMMFTAQEAQAVPSVDAYQSKIRDQQNLKGQLAGISKNLADQILQLNDLTDNQIPAAQDAASVAQQQAEQAQSLAQATNERLEAARKDKSDLEAQIKKTGADYDDAREAVAQLARDSFHGSSASDVMDVVTDSTTTQDFVDKMQSDAAVTRIEANAANEAATTLNTSMNRQQRLSAIEDQISELKRKADQQAAAAQSTVQDARAKQAQLEALREQGNTERARLEEQKSGLTTKAAKEAAEIVAMKSQIDAYNEQQAIQRAAQAKAKAAAQQQIGKANPRPSQPSQPARGNGGGRGGNTSGSSSGRRGGNGGGGSASGMNYAVPGSCPEGSSFCYGHSTGNTIGGRSYPARQCTLWAYIRRSQMGLPVGSHMGNGGRWAATARSLGYLVNRTPHVGAVVVFARGQSVGGVWTASWQYGHVAIVERVNADGSILISEGGTKSAWPTWQILADPGSYEYIHY
ncbi:MAG: CHAP domain-containing protein [Bifidobacterium sp.]|nr:CHAP domain-containing protein [Bifidobacterium sp.]